MPLSSTGVFTCMSCGGQYVTSHDKPVAIAGRRCQCDPDKRPARFHGPQFGVPGWKVNLLINATECFMDMPTPARRRDVEVAIKTIRQQT